MADSGLTQYLLNTISRDKWKRITAHKRSGVVIPLFSIYSKESLGIGDLQDLKMLIDWAHSTGNTIIQLLPMNEMGSIFCPYDSLSSFAIEPAYICPETLITVKDKTIKAKIDDLRKAFPAGKAYVDYGIKKEKINLLRQIYDSQGKRDSAQFKKFKEENAYWLEDFVLYKALKDHHQGRPWYEWEDKYYRRDSQALNDFAGVQEKEIVFQEWMQWQLYKQFKEAKAYAKDKGVLLKGDLPILVSRDSADVWQHPEFFKLEFAAGAPPDMYCAKGQRWGMPTYNWERISSDGYRYLKEKLKYSQEFYDTLRIDHVVGLFRIWSISYNEPLENKGLNGFFDPSNESEWESHGRNLLSLIIENTKMLICAEDLGVIPRTCTTTLEEFGIPGNDVQRWVKDWKVLHDFLELQDYRAISVAMLSTHDTTNWPAWWENEAGTVDEGLFIRRCSDHRQINFDNVKAKLFDLKASRHGRLRWLNSIDSVNKLIWILGRKKEELADFIEMYENTYREKEKLWRHLGLAGPMRQSCDTEIVRAALKITLASASIFCINTLIDWLYLAEIFKGDSYKYRINTPGTVSPDNWSLTLPISLEELLKHKVNKEIKKMISASGRI